MKPKVCPRCKLTNTHDAKNCDCGYKFDAGLDYTEKIKEPYRFGKNFKVLIDDLYFSQLKKDRILFNVFIGLLILSILFMNKILFIFKGNLIGIVSIHFIFIAAAVYLKEKHFIGRPLKNWPGIIMLIPSYISLFYSIGYSICFIMTLFIVKLLIGTKNSGSGTGTAAPYIFQVMQVPISFILSAIGFVITVKKIKSILSSSFLYYGPILFSFIPLEISNF